MSDLAIREKLARQAAAAKQAAAEAEAAKQIKDSIVASRARAKAQKAKSLGKDLVAKPVSATELVAEEPVEKTPVPKTEEQLRAERARAARAKSFPDKKQKPSLDSRMEAAFSDTASTVASESESSMRSVIAGLMLNPMAEKDLRKKLRTLYEIRVLEETIATAKLKGTKINPTQIAKVEKKKSIVSDPVVQRFRRAGGCL